MTRALRTAVLLAGEFALAACGSVGEGGDGSARDARVERDGSAIRELDASAGRDADAPLADAIANDGSPRPDVPRPVAMGDCPTPSGGESVLAAAATGIAPASYCQIGMGGLRWGLVHAPPIAAESHLEYGSTGVYDARRKRVRYFGGPHTGLMQCLEYDEASNEWYHCDNPRGVWDGHGYDHNTIDPATGDHYIRRYNQNDFYVWDGTAWSMVARPSGDCDPGMEPAYGIAWDSARNGLVTMHQFGSCFWSRASGTWRLDGDLSGDTTASYHQAAEHHEALGVTWLQDGNGSVRHFKNDRGTVTRLRDAPMGIGCCGSGGYFSAYDARTERFIVVPIDGGLWWEYDIAADVWTSFANELPTDDEGVVVTLAPYDALLFVFERGEGNDPEAFVYKHERVGG